MSDVNNIRDDACANLAPLTECPFCEGFDKGREAMLSEVLEYLRGPKSLQVEIFVLSEDQITVSDALANELESKFKGDK